MAGIPQAYVNQAKESKVKCLADILLRLNILLRQIAFLLILLKHSRLRTQYNMVMEQNLYPRKSN
jgi:hypothetical protein